MAGEIFGRPITKKDEEERWLGKGVILGCGYGMGWRRFAATCAMQGRVIPDALAEKAVRSYRTTYDRIPALWRSIEARAKEAVRRPGETVELDSTGRIKFRTWNDWLLMRLPSGRRIFYREPKIEVVEGEEQLTYLGVNSFTKKWGRQRTHGPRLTENAVQGLCRDIIAEALLRVGTRWYQPILTIHDEIICEVADGHGSKDEIEALISEAPAWAEGFPIAAEGKQPSRRYAK
jgi:DNA polymerase